MTTQTNGRRASGDGIVIAGGGLAGQRCSEALRRGGYEGAIRVVCSEPHRPYDRPPLSKQLLLDATQDAGLPYRSAQWYDEHSVDLLLGVSATGLDPAARRLRLSDGGGLRYEQVLICTGGRPRTLPVLAGYDNVTVLRTLDDARTLREVLVSSPRLAVVGAGFIGLEIAATARRLGVEVTLIEAGACPLAGVIGPELGGWFARLHADEGVTVLTRVTVDRVHANGTVRALRLSDGSSVAVDHVVVGVGIEPDVGWYPRVALGGRRPPGRARRSGDARSGPGPRAVDELLDRSVRPADPVRRSTAARGRDRDRRRSGQPQLHRHLLPCRTGSRRAAG